MLPSSWRPSQTLLPWCNPITPAPPQPLPPLGSLLDYVCTFLAQYHSDSVVIKQTSCNKTSSNLCITPSCRQVMRINTLITAGSHWQKRNKKASETWSRPSTIFSQHIMKNVRKMERRISYWSKSPTSYSPRRVVKSVCHWKNISRMGPPLWFSYWFTPKAVSVVGFDNRVH